MKIEVHVDVEKQRLPLVRVDGREPDRRGEDDLVRACDERDALAAAGALLTALAASYFSDM